MNKIDFRGHWGKGAINKLADVLRNDIREVKKVAIIIGGGSAKRLGFLDNVTKQIESVNAEWTLIEGIKPNPTNVQINDASVKVREFGADVVIGLGGGSVVDASKVITYMAYHEEIKDSWELVGKTLVDVNLEANRPTLVSIITAAGTASETNDGTVITNEESVDKKPVGTLYPDFSLIDPELTMSTTPWQTASGSMDSLSHYLEQYFLTNDDSGLFGKELTIAGIKTLVKYTKRAMNENDYAARSALSLATSFSLNYLVNIDREGNGNWMVHDMEHMVSAIWDVTHGAGLALITPTQIRVMTEKFEGFKVQAEYVNSEVFGNDLDLATNIENWIKDVMLPTKWSDFTEINVDELTESKVDEMISKTWVAGNEEWSAIYKEILMNIKK